MRKVEIGIFEQIMVTTTLTYMPIVKEAMAESYEIEEATRFEYVRLTIVSIFCSSAKLVKSGNR